MACFNSLLRDFIFSSRGLSDYCVKSMSKEVLELSLRFEFLALNPAQERMDCHHHLFNYPPPFDATEAIAAGFSFVVKFALCNNVLVVQKKVLTEEIQVLCPAHFQTFSLLRSLLICSFSLPA